MEFRVNTRMLNGVADRIQESRAILSRDASNIENVIKYLYNQDESFREIAQKLRGAQKSVNSLARTCNQMDITAREIAALYRTTEQKNVSYSLIRLLNAIRALLEYISTTNENNHYEVDNIIFSDPKHYGGDQASPMSVTDEARRRELYDIIRKNNPGEKLTDKQLDNYLKKLNSEGCGYVAVINTILAEYAGREDEFEKTFGYPMYYKGKPNYDMLLVDFYSSMDNRDSEGNYDKYADYDSSKDGPRHRYDPWSDTSGSGSSQDDRAYYLKEFMGKRGVDVDINNNVKVTADNFREISEAGKQVIVSFSGGNLLNMDGTVNYENIPGHAMSVTGVTSDGKLIVSSWGGQYMIDPNAPYSRMNFSTVEY